MTKPFSRLRLIHGRHDPDAEMDDWGFDGPSIDDVLWMHVTYNATFNLGFATAEAAQRAQALTGWESFDENVVMMPMRNDLVFVPGVPHLHMPDPIPSYFGDWELQIGEGVL